MQYLLLCAAILLPESLAFPIPQPEPGYQTDVLILKSYLDRFFPVTQELSLGERIKQMQSYLNLKKTGKLNNETKETMKQPRCGIPDVGDYTLFPGSPKWEKNRLTYKIVNYTPYLSKRSVEDAITRAFKVWSDETPLEFVKVSGTRADIVIKFAQREHGDGYPFDGRGNTLAHAFAPGKGIGGDAHFDNEERWSETNQEINLFLVAAHEFGHSLGLSHSNVREALMYPIYTYVDPKTFKLPDDDRQGIQKLYGK
ncbi:MMP7 protein, partial [Heliornis fulica]|nr:MMP7 protein [Heliornis fulica]